MNQTIAKNRRRLPRSPRAVSTATRRRSYQADPLQGLSDDRRQVVVNEAAYLFCRKGYENTSMRDIAAAVGILPGSLYHYFPSKEHLFVAVNSFAVSQTLDVIRAAMAGRSDPWGRLEAACIAHMQSLLEKDRFASVLSSPVLIDSLPNRKQVIALRDQYEAVFKELVADLPLPVGTDRRIFRLGLLGAMNWATTWYRPNGEPIRNIVRKFLNTFRRA